MYNVHIRVPVVFFQTNQQTKTSNIFQHKVFYVGSGLPSPRKILRDNGFYIDFFVALSISPQAVGGVYILSHMSRLNQLKLLS